MSIKRRLFKLEASKPRLPLSALVIEPGPGETNAEAKERHLSMHPELIGAPIIFLRLSRGLYEHQNQIV